MTLGCAGGLGSGPFGSMPFGSGYALGILSVVQDTLNSVVVEFSSPPRAGDPSDVRDATNPYNWTLSVREPFSARLRLVQFAERVDALHVRIYFDGELTALATYRLTASPTIENLSGGAVSPLCSEMDFETFSPQRFALPEAARRRQSVDLANPYLPRDAPSPTSPLGTFQIDDTGDFATDFGRANLRKRVLRRATTLLGEFFHMPTYGAGLRLKALIRADTLIGVQNALTRQIKLEPDVTTVSVAVSTIQTSQGTIVRLVIQVTDTNGDVEPVVAELPVG